MEHECKKEDSGGLDRFNAGGWGIGEVTKRWRDLKYIVWICMIVAQWNLPNAVWKWGDEGGDIREYNRGMSLFKLQYMYQWNFNW